MPATDIYSAVAHTFTDESDSKFPSHTKHIPVPQSALNQVIAAPGQHTLPRIRINQEYARLIGRDASHAAMRTQLQEARWLLKSLEIRNDTLIRVARAIVERQTEFLEHGEEHMRPMILRDIAEAIGMHESTVSRVTSGKYMHTPRGVFELRYFFSSQVEAADGSGTSSTAIRAKIRKLVKDEDPETPLSDGRIADLLSGEGIPVARRTVAKYREAMGIAPSNERKRAAAFDGGFFRFDLPLLADRLAHAARWTRAPPRVPMPRKGMRQGLWQVAARHSSPSTFGRDPCRSSSSGRWIPRAGRV